MSRVDYRPEIDGLRGISVIGVILFHAGLFNVTGGYLGVDVFFVISGFLIASILLKERETFSIKLFYERRMRRIIPPVVVMIVLTFPFVFLYFFPNDLLRFARSVLAALAFVSNIYFSRNIGYFDHDAHFEPLLHLWSLAIEEQFYLIFPALLFFGTLRGKKKAVWGGVTLAVIAYSMPAVLGVSSGKVFFSVLFRAWELLSGATAALYLDAIASHHRTLRGPWREALAVTGLILVLASFFLFDEASSVLFSVVPVLGAVALVLFGTGGTWASRVLQLPVFRWVGLSSYSAYLYHQPLFSLVRYVVQTPIGWIGWSCLSLLSLALGFLSYILIEKPFRSRARISLGVTSAAVGSGYLGLLAVSIVVVHYEGFPERIPEGVEWRSLGEKIDVQGDVCRTVEDGEFKGVETCEFGDVTSSRTLALYGDSHAQAIQYQLDQRLRERGVKGLWIKAQGCHIVPDVVENGSVADIEVCRSSFKQMLDLIRLRVDLVLVVSRWTMRMYPIDKAIDDLSFDNLEGGVEYNRYREYSVVLPDGGLSKGPDDKRNALRKFLDEMSTTGKPVYVIYPIPELGWDIAKLNFFAGDTLRTITTSRHLYESRNRFIIGIFDSYRAVNVHMVPVADLLCDMSRCYGQRDGVPLYYDDDHLSSRGADLVLDALFSRIPDF